MVNVPSHLLTGILTARIAGNPGAGEMMAAKANRQSAEWFRRTLPRTRFKDLPGQPKAHQGNANSRNRQGPVRPS